MGTIVDLDPSFSEADIDYLVKKADRAKSLGLVVEGLKNLRNVGVIWGGMFLAAASLEGGPQARDRAIISAGSLIAANLFEGGRQILQGSAEVAGAAEHVISGLVAIDPVRAGGNFPRDGEAVG